MFQLHELIRSEESNEYTEGVPLHKMAGPLMAGLGGLGTSVTGKVISLSQTKFGEMAVALM